MAKIHSFPGIYITRKLRDWEFMHYSSAYKSENSFYHHWGNWRHGGWWTQICLNLNRGGSKASIQVSWRILRSPRHLDVYLSIGPCTLGLGVGNSA